LYGFHCSIDFSSFSGLHVVVIMFTGYLVGFAMFKALFNNNAVLVSSLGHFL
jgi:hypothetical protein